MFTTAEPPFHLGQGVGRKMAILLSTPFLVHNWSSACQSPRTHPHSSSWKWGQQIECTPGCRETTQSGLLPTQIWGAQATAGGDGRSRAWPVNSSNCKKWKPFSQNPLFSLDLFRFQWIHRALAPAGNTLVPTNYKCPQCSSDSPPHLSHFTNWTDRFMDKSLQRLKKNKL